MGEGNELGLSEYYTYFQGVIQKLENSLVHSCIRFVSGGIDRTAGGSCLRICRSTLIEEMRGR